MKTLRWTIHDLTALPDDGTRYEIIDGELYMSRQPNYNHQQVCTQITILLGKWSKETGLGVVTGAPSIIFSDEDAVAPDLIWISKARRATALEADGKLHSAPELVIEVLSPGNANESRDREVKRKLYSRRGVNEYWLVSWPKREVEIYRRSQETYALELIHTLYENDILQSPNLPGFECQVGEIFEDIVY